MQNKITDDENYLKNIDFSDDRIKPIKYSLVTKMQKKLLPAAGIIEQLMK